MDEHRKIEGALRRLYGRVDLSGVWDEIEARAAGGRGRKAKAQPVETQAARVPQVSSRRLRWAVYVPVALLLVAGIAIGTVFAVEQSQQEPAVSVTVDGPTTTTIPPAADYSRGGQWKRLAVSGAGGQVSNIVMDPTDSQVLYAVTQEGLYKTTDAAGSWRKILEFEGTPEVAVDPVSPSTVYVISPNLDLPKIQRSDDGGASWTELNNAILLESSYKSEYVWDGAAFGPPVTVGAAQASTIYVDADSGAWRSVDKGASWSKTTRAQITSKAVGWIGSPGVSSALGLFGKTVEDPEDGSASMVEVAIADPDNGVVVYAGTMGGGIYKSVDGGATWRKASIGLTSSPVYWFVADPVSPSVLYAITASGIQKSTNGGATWNLILAGGEFFAPSRRMPNGGSAGSSMIPCMVVAPSSPSTLYAWNGQGISRSDDGGATWKLRAGEGLLTVASEPTGYTGRLALVCADNPDVVLAQTNGGVFRSADGGDTWTVATGMYRAWGVIADPYRPSVLYVAGYAEEPPFPTREELKKGVWDMPPRYLFKSVDAGATWAAVVNTAGWGVSSQLDFDSHDPAYLYFYTSDDDSGAPRARLMRSLDEGVTWEQVDWSALGKYFNSPLFDPRSPGTMYARVDSQEGDDYYMVGVFRSTDGGTTWKNIVDDLVADDTSLTLFISPADGTIYATSPRGLFKWVPRD